VARHNVVRPGFVRVKDRSAGWTGLRECLGIDSVTTGFGQDRRRCRRTVRLSRDQLFDEVLVAKYGAAKAAEVRKPLGG
jgi:hypothetical protein